MKTNFFSSLDPMIEGVDLSITIKKKEDQLTVVIFSIPRIDDHAKEQIRPLSMTDTAAELDKQFFPQIQTPMQQVSAWSTEMKAFEESIAKAEAESQRAKEEDKALQKKKDAAKKKYEKGEAFMDDGKPRQAIPLLTEALNIYPDYPEAKKLLQQARAKAGMSQDLFDNPAKTSNEGNTGEDQHPSKPSSSANDKPKEGESLESKEVSKPKKQ